MSSTKSENDAIIYSIGHSNHPFTKLAELLRQHSIQALIDVRSKPQSRWVPHFNRKNLEVAIPDLSIEYQWRGNYLGGIPDDPTYWKPNPRQRKADPPKIVDYDKVARQKWFQEAIDQLLEIANEKRTAIMCSEENPQNCHRSKLIGQTLVKRGAKVMHIRRSGALESQSVDHTMESPIP
jgi:uncharacterized protein (DUF488 family)